jgi:mannose-6-phosphate isomerase-like protein (cupin superfamily)
MSGSSMASRGETIENPLTGERMTFLETARDTNGELLRMDYVAPPRYKGPTEHVHLLQEERFEVVSGVLGVRVGGRELHLEEGQSAVGPPGVPHKWWNPGEEEVRFVAELRPALNTEEFFETAWGLARDGKATGLGIPKNPLQLAVLAGAHQGEAYFTAFPWPPIPVQKALFGVLSLLAPLARLVGYKERYPEYSGPEPPLGK